MQKDGIWKVLEGLLLGVMLLGTVTVSSLPIAREFSQRSYASEARSSAYVREIKGDYGNLSYTPVTVAQELPHRIYLPYVEKSSSNPAPGTPTSTTVPTPTPKDGTPTPLSQDGTPTITPPAILTPTRTNTPTPTNSPTVTVTATPTPDNSNTFLAHHYFCSRSTSPKLWLDYDEAAGILGIVPGIPSQYVNERWVIPSTALDILSVTQLDSGLYQTKGYYGWHEAGFIDVVFTTGKSYATVGSTITDITRFAESIPDLGVLFPQLSGKSGIYVEYYEHNTNTRINPWNYNGKQLIAGDSGDPGCFML
ncbi:MAG: hypothetical protein HYW24_04510 [Candidatus Aenigmarchaeota archaeon]|nr:hypothetical protein [Candidatus Aenigmarchaeota archaeon]